MCPVTLQEMNGSHPFVVLMSTGWVMAEKATKEVGIAGLQVIAYSSALDGFNGPPHTALSPRFLDDNLGISVLAHSNHGRRKFSRAILLPVCYVAEGTAVVLAANASCLIYANLSTLSILRKTLELRYDTVAEHLVAARVIIVGAGWHREFVACGAFRLHSSIYLQ